MLVAASAITLAGAEDFKIAVKPVFEGMRPSDQAFPIMLDIENSGPDARGILTVSTGSYVVNYPIELPRGSRKQVQSFPIGVPNEGEIDVRLDTNQGEVRKKFRDDDWYYGQGQTLGMITDSPGLMTFIRQQTKETDVVGGPQEMFSDGYVSADSAPDRAVGYASLSGLVLADGAERLSDKQVQAIKLWMLTGGKLIFVGGASSPVLADPRWRDTLPVKHLVNEALPPASFVKLSSSPLDSMVQCTLGQPVEGSEIPERGIRAGNERPLLVTKRIGLGKAIFMGFNPFEPPMSRWEGRRGLFLFLAQPLDRSASTFIQRFVFEDNENWRYMGAPSPSTVPAGVTIYDPYQSQLGASEDPFRASIPPTEKVGWILAAYFIAVVPLNFLVLKRLKRVEWAWVTSPLISLGFGFYFFSVAGDLYSASLSRATSGVLVAAEGFDRGEYIGRSQLFFPRGGRYDLHLSGVDQIRPSQGDPYDYYRPRARTGNQMAELNASDLGEIKAPALSVGNLSFREFSFRQVFPNAQSTVSPGKWFTLKGSFGRTARAITFTGSITNNSPITLTNPVLTALPFSHALGKELKPGETLPIKAKMSLDVIKSRQPDKNLTVRGLRLEGPFTGLEAGPIVGQRVGQGGLDFLVYSFDRDLPKELQ